MEGFQVPALRHVAYFCNEDGKDSNQDQIFIPSLQLSLTINGSVCYLFEPACSIQAQEARKRYIRLAKKNPLPTWAAYYSGLGKVMREAQDKSYTPLTLSRATLETIVKLSKGPASEADSKRLRELIVKLFRPAVISHMSAMEQHDDKEEKDKQNQIPAVRYMTQVMGIGARGYDSAEIFIESYQLNISAKGRVTHLEEPLTTLQADKARDEILEKATHSDWAMTKLNIPKAMAKANETAFTPILLPRDLVEAIAKLHKQEVQLTEEIKARQKQLQDLTVKLFVDA